MANTISRTWRTSELIEAGKMEAVYDRRYGLAQVPDALRFLESGEARGKAVMTN